MKRLQSVAVLALPLIGCSTVQQPDYIYGFEGAKCPADAATFTELSAIGSDTEGLTLEGRARCTVDTADAELPYVNLSVSWTGWQHDFQITTDEDGHFSFSRPADVKAPPEDNVRVSFDVPEREPAWVEVEITPGSDTVSSE
ncbi:MAG: hypothetical protein AAF799_06115 [Myxococcota bacterium]